MKIGRNQLCPCNSGKKYKHCCIDKKEPTINIPNIEEDFLKMIFNLRKLLLKSKKHIKKYEKARKIHGEVLDSMLNFYDKGKYDLNKELKKASKSILKEIHGDSSKFDAKFDHDNELELKLFHDTFIYKHHKEMTSLTEEYLIRNKFKAEEKVKMLNAMNNVYISLFEIVNVDSENAYVELKDVFNKKVFKIIDISLSSSQNAKDTYLYCNILTFEDISFNVGTGISFAKNNKDIIDYIKNYNPDTSELIRCLYLYDIFKKSNMKIMINNI